MSKYDDLVKTPPVITIVKNAREVIFTLTSVMCDNQSTLSFKKDAKGDFKLILLGECFENMQTKHDHIEMEWAADDANWQTVVKMINTGTRVVSQVRSR